MKRMLWMLACLGAAASALAQTASPPPVPAPPGDWRPPAVACADLKRAPLAHAHIELAEERAAGPFQAPPTQNPVTGAAQTPPPTSVPAFCRIAATLKPTRDSAIRIEVWLPAAGWNGKFLGVGNGGFAGSILYGDLAAGIRAGYVTVSTDTGHQGGSPKAFDHAKPAVLTDYGWRAAHEMTLAAKQLVRRYYGAAPTLSYFSGCSGGGRMALIEAQRFPDDYDGVLAGSAAFSYARVTAADLWVARTNIIDGQPVLQARQFALLRQAALAQCDALDGAVDGELSNPRACRLDTAKLQCAAGRSAGCLTPEQIAVADKLYAGMRNPRSGAWLWNGMLPGGENAYVGAATTPFALAQDFFRYMVFHRADWDYTQLDFGGDIEHAEKLTADILARPDLRDFGRHGKLIQYAGWNENTPPPEDAIDYYDAAAARAGGLAAESRFHKLFVVPNGNHCRGGYSAPWFTALTRWVEADSPPDGLIANRLGTAAAGTEAPVIGQRPLCAYPMVARYRGAGDINSAESFECVAAPLGTRRSAAQ